MNTTVRSNQNGSIVNTRNNDGHQHQDAFYYHNDKESQSGEMNRAIITEAAN